MCDGYLSLVVVRIKFVSNKSFNDSFYIYREYGPTHKTTFFSESILSTKSHIGVLSTRLDGSLFFLHISSLFVQKMLQATCASYVVAFVVVRKNRHFENAFRTRIRELNLRHMFEPVFVNNLLGLRARALENIFTPGLVARYGAQRICRTVKCTKAFVPATPKWSYAKGLECAPHLHNLPIFMMFYKMSLVKILDVFGVPFCYNS